MRLPIIVSIDLSLSHVALTASLASLTIRQVNARQLSDRRSVPGQHGRMFGIA
jgi:hypothetical protein